MDLGRALLAAMLLAIVAFGGCGGGETDGDADGDSDADADGDGDGDADGDDIDSDVEQGTDAPFAVTNVVPSHGIFSGFSEVVIRGRGFESGAVVAFGDGRGGWSEVGTDAAVVVDENRIAVLTPPGPPDTWVDVLVTQGEEEALWSEGCPSCSGFYYDPCQLDPASGSVAGGTYVVVSCIGTELYSGVEVTFDGEDAQDIEVVSATELHLRTPPGTPGPADVVISSVGGDIELAEAYTYFENSDPSSGGLGGDPIDGNIEVAVIDMVSGQPLADSFVMIGVDNGTEYQGRTDDGGHIVFSGPDLAGRQLIITVSHGPVPTPMDYDCDDVPETDMETYYETTSFTEFDATYVTVLLQPIPPPPPMCPGDMPAGSVAYIEGELIFESMGEFGPYDWEIVPTPRSPDEIKLTYVQTTAPDIFLDPLQGEWAETGTIPGGICPARECEVDADCRPFRNQIPCGEEECPYVTAVCNREVHQCAVPQVCEDDDDCPFTDTHCDEELDRCLSSDECDDDGDCDEFDDDRTEASCDLASSRCVISEEGGDPRPVVQVGPLVQRGYVVVEDGAGDLAIDSLTHGDVGVVGQNGFTYCLSSRFGVVAVWAIAGIYNTTTGRFVPYAFGINRGVLVSPEETVTDVDIMMVTPLDESLFVSLDDPPTQQGWDMGPNRYIVESYVDLGVEGVIWRRDRQSTSEFPSDLHYFSSWMPREGALADATLTVVANAFSFSDVDGDGEEDLVYPFSVRYLRGVTNWASEVTVGDWIGISQPDDPDYGGVVTDNRLAWEGGAGDYHFTNVRIIRDLSTAPRPYWDMILPGDQVEVDLPLLPEDLASISGDAQFDVWHHRVRPGFDYDLWSYGDLGRDAQDGYSANAWLISFE